jgi:hypothetical protein
LRGQVGSQKLGNPKVQKLQPLFADQDVARFDVTVSNLALMSIMNRAAYLLKKP